MVNVVNITELHNLTQEAIGKKIFLADFARIWNVGRANVSDRAKRNSPVTVSELQKVEAEFGVSLYKSGAYDGSRQNDTSLEEKIKNFGKRVSELQAQHNFLDREMATLIKISEKDYLKLVTGKNLPNLDILMNIKRNFNVSIDYLLWG